MFLGSLFGHASPVPVYSPLVGEPSAEPIVMWWNFIGRSHEEVVAFRADWERQRTGLGTGRYGVFPDAWEHPLPAPDLPNVRLRPRR